AREAVDQHLSVAGGLIDPETGLAGKARAATSASRFYARWLPQLAVGKGYVPSGFEEFGRLATHLRFVERASRRLARSTFYGMARWQGRLERKQRFLGRIVDIGAELFAISATCVRTRMLVDDRAPAAQEAVELAELFCRGARRRARRGRARGAGRRPRARGAGGGRAGRAVRPGRPPPGRAALPRPVGQRRH